MRMDDRRPWLQGQGGHVVVVVQDDLMGLRSRRWKGGRGQVRMGSADDCDGRWGREPMGRSDICIVLQLGGQLLPNAAVTMPTKSILTFVDALQR